MSFLSAVTSRVTEMLGPEKTELEKKLDQALSKENWGAPTSLLRDIASSTHSGMDYPVVMREVWASLDHAGKNWRQIFKGLVLLEYIIKFGAERVVDDARERLFRIRTLSDFTYYESNTDKGSGIREKSKQLVELLNDNQKLRAEREKAREVKDKFTAVTNTGGGGSYGAYPSHGSSTYGSYTGSGSYSGGGGGDEWDRGRGGGGGGSYDDVVPKRHVEDSKTDSFDSFSSSTMATTADKGKGRRHVAKTDASNDDFDTAFKAAPAKKPAAASNNVSFDDFAPAPTKPAPQVSVKPAAKSFAPAPAPAVGFDAFQPASSNAHSGDGLSDLFAATSISHAPAPASQAASFDPFASSAVPSSAPKPAATAFDPFAPSAAPAAKAPVFDASSEFGMFNTAPPAQQPKDKDVEKLFSFDLAGASKPSTTQATTPVKAVPLNALASQKPVAPTSSMGASSVMSGYASGAGGSISAMSPGTGPAYPPASMHPMQWPGAHPGYPPAPGGYPSGPYGMPQAAPPAYGMPPQGFGYNAAPSGGGYPPATQQRDPFSGMFG